MISIAFKNNNVEKYCNNLKLVQKEFGLQIAKKLSQRLDDLKSFNTVFEVLNSGIDNPHLLIGDLDGCIGWDLNATVRIIIRICDSFAENTVEQSKTITSVTVEGVRDYHGGNKKWLIN